MNYFVFLFFVVLICIANVESDCKCKEWTRWYDDDDASGSGDYEKRFYNPDICDGNLPHSIKCATVDNEIDYFDYDFQSGTSHYCNVDDGFVCINDPNDPDTVECPDFKTKYCCDLSYVFILCLFSVK